MVKQTALLPILAIGFTALALSACSKKEEQAPSGHNIPTLETFPIENTKLVNCRFKNPVPSYAFKAAIEANPILCDEGVPRKVQLLTPTALPSGIVFTDSQLSLTGTPEERVLNSPYEFYIENEAGYALVKISISVR